MSEIFLWAALALTPLSGGAKATCPDYDCCCCCEKGPCEGCCGLGGWATR